MQLSFRIFAMSLVVAAGLLAVPAAPADEKKTDAWISLFNGKDLTGWKTHDNPNPGAFAKIVAKEAGGKVIQYVGVTKEDKEIPLWTVVGGEIVGTGPHSHLFTDKDDYTDFHYRVEAKINDKGNSGQYFRTQFGPDFPKGYEAQINATGGDKIKTGSLYLPQVKEVLVLDTAPHKIDEYFVQEVIAKGNRIQIFVNGKKTVDYEDPKSTYLKGHFALQGHDPGTVVTFKKVEYKPLKK